MHHATLYMIKINEHTTPLAANSHNLSHRPRCMKVIQCTGCVSANAYTRCHQLCWGDRKWAYYMSCACNTNVWPYVSLVPRLFLCVYMCNKVCMTLELNTMFFCCVQRSCIHACTHCTRVGKSLGMMLHVQYIYMYNVQCGSMHNYNFFFKIMSVLSEH